MRIAQVAPLHESVPPKYYGGTERVVSYLTEELVRRGHEVTLFASGDSHTRANLIAPCGEALRSKNSCSIPYAYEAIQLGHVGDRAHHFDVIHFHTDCVHFPFARDTDTATITTLHGRLDIPELTAVFEQFPQTSVVSISDAQRRPLPRANWQKTVYHGLPQDLYTFHEEPGDYLAFIGRISPEKRVDRAIDIARRVGLPLKVAAKVDSADRSYFEAEIQPLMDAPEVDFIGEIGEDEKNDFLGRARALLFPIDWPEPFGLVMIEAFACGTPVLAYPRGAVPEVMADGRSGFLVDSLDEAVEAVERLSDFDRRGCRAYFEERFNASRMADDYVELFEKVASPARSSVGGSAPTVVEVDGNSDAYRRLPVPHQRQ